MKIDINIGDNAKFQGEHIQVVGKAQMAGHLNGTEYKWTEWKLTSLSGREYWMSFSSYEGFIFLAKSDAGSVRKNAITVQGHSYPITDSIDAQAITAEGDCEHNASKTIRYLTAIKGKDYISAELSLSTGEKEFFIGKMYPYRLMADVFGLKTNLLKKIRLKINRI